jgi:uncharacterized protein YeeX (DUF496 family)
MLISLAKQLSENLKAEVLAAVQEIRDEATRVEALSSLIRHLPSDLQSEAMRTALATAQEIVDKRQKVRVLTDLTEYLSEDLQGKAIREAVAIARKISDKQTRAEALSRLHKYLPKGLKMEILREALAAAQEIADERWKSRALVDLVEHLPTNSQAEAFPLAFLALKEEQRPYLLDPYTDLIRLWQKTDFIGLESSKIIWAEHLHTRADQRRDKLIQDLSVLIPLTEHLGGQQAVMYTLCALRDVTRWWP